MWVYLIMIMFIAFIAMVNAFMISCTDDDDDDAEPTPIPTATSTPLPQAEIRIYSDPDPVPYSDTDNLGYNYWRFTFYVDEVAYTKLAALHLSLFNRIENGREISGIHRHRFS